MTASIFISIPGEPRRKERPRVTMRGGFASAYTPKTTVTAEKDIASCARVAMGAGKPMEGPVRVRVEAVFGIPKAWNRKVTAAALEGRVPCMNRIDGDNVLKLCEDALNGIVWVDDRQVTAAIVIKRYGAPARTEITVQAVEIAGMVMPPGKRTAAD